MVLIRVFRRQRHRGRCFLSSRYSPQEIPKNFRRKSRRAFQASPRGFSVQNLVPLGYTPMTMSMTATTSVSGTVMTRICTCKRMSSVGTSVCAFRIRVHYFQRERIDDMYICGRVFRYPIHFPRRPHRRLNWLGRRSRFGPGITPVGTF